MTRLDMKNYGTEAELRHTHLHMLAHALDTFLTSELPDTVLAALIELSIGLEVFLKREVDEKSGMRLSHRRGLDRKKKSLWSEVRAETTRKRQRRMIEEVAQNCPVGARTITFGEAIELFPYYHRVSAPVLKDLRDLREYRNGLFHWEAETTRAFKLSKQALRLFQWMFVFVEKKQGWWLGGPMNVLDPDGRQRKKLDQLQNSVRSENLFNVQRRVWRHHAQHQFHAQANARLSGRVTIPDARPWPDQRCPACGSSTLALYGTGPLPRGGRSVCCWCRTCDLRLADTEYEVLKPSGMPGLGAVFADLPRT